MPEPGRDAVERTRDGVERIFTYYYGGSGGGNPRVPSNLPLILQELRTGLLDICWAQDVVDDPRERLSTAALLCRDLVSRLLEVSARVRDTAAELPDLLRVSGLQFGRRWPEIIEQRVRDGELPFPNSEICPCPATEAWRCASTSLLRWSPSRRRPCGITRNSMRSGESLTNGLSSLRRSRRN